MPDGAPLIWTIGMIIIWVIAVISVPSIIIWRSGIRTVIIMSDYRVVAVVDANVLAVIHIDIDIIISTIIATRPVAIVVIIANIVIVATWSVAIIVIVANIVIPAARFSNIVVSANGTTTRAIS